MISQDNTLHTETQVFAESTASVLGFDSWPTVSGMRCYPEVDQLSIQRLLTPEGGGWSACCMCRRGAEHLQWGKQAFHLSSCWESPSERSVRESTDTPSRLWPRLPVTAMVLGGLATSTVFLQYSELGGFTSWGFFSLFYLQVLNSKFQSTISSFSFKICMQVHVFPRFQCLSEL